MIDDRIVAVTDLTRCRRRLGFGLVGIMMILLGLALAAGPADAAGIRPSLATFPPTFGNAQGLAVDQSSGDVLVVDAGGQAVSRWHQNGTPSNFAALGTNVIDGKLGPGGKLCAEEPSSCDAESDTVPNGFAFGAAAKEVQVAIDESGSVTDGNIYVTQAASKLIDIFAADGRYLGQLTQYVNPSSEVKPLGKICGVAVDQNGIVYVSDASSGIHKFVPSLNPPVTADNVTTFGAEKNLCTLAVGTENVFAARFNGLVVLKIDSTTGIVECRISNGALFSPTKAWVTAITANPANGHVFVIRDFGASSEVAEYDGSCPPEPAVDAEVLSTAGLIDTGQGAAINAVTDQLYVSRLSSANLDVFGPPVPPPTVVTQPAAPIGKVSATLKGSVNPEGLEVEECAFEYGTTEVYGETVPCIETSAEIGSGTDPKPVHADVSGLEAGVLYHFRLRAKNLSGTGVGKDQKFATRVPPLIEDEWVAGASYTGATLMARINPKFYPTAFRIEYGPDVSYGLSTPDIIVGSDNAVHTVTAPLDGLGPGATYHWRVVATNDNTEKSEGKDGILHTYAVPDPDTCPNAFFRIGPGALLPDCRAYEMVSPVDKNGGDIVAAESPSGTSGYFQAADSGGKITYTSASAFGDAVRGAFANQYLATRASGGWSSHALNPSQGTTVFDVAGTDLGSRLDLDIGTGINAFTPDLCFTSMVDWNFSLLAPEAIPAYTNLYWRDNCGPGADTYEAITRSEEVLGPPLNSGYGVHLKLEARNYSHDRSRVVFSSQAALTLDAAPGINGKHQIYVRSDAGLRLVSVLPNGKASLENNSVGTGDVGHKASLARAVSEDGSRVFWTTNASAGFVNASGSLYVRKNSTNEQSKLDAGGECTEVDKACTMSIFEASGSTRGQFWTANPQGSKAIFSFGDNPAAGSDLSEFDVDSEIETPIAGKVGGVVGASEDLSYLYFTSKEDLDEGAVEGEWNLYLRHGGMVSLIATILSDDRTFAGVDSLDPQARRNRVSPDGRHLVFMSAASLTGYDNTDAGTGEAASEIFHYDADRGRLSCASCNPSGARPLGGTVSGLRTAAWIPGWEWSNHDRRVLSGDGNRLFFNAFDALVPADVNGVQDVYQWEAPGAGGCHTGDASYSALNAGCVNLISTGHSGDESEFVDASVDGADAFISTNSSIDSRDPGLIDIYDAREGGGYPSPEPEPMPCVGDACQNIPAAPVVRTPGTVLSHGPGDPTAKPAKPCGKGKRRVMRNGKSRCVRKHRQSKRRANKNRRAAR